MGEKLFSDVTEATGLPNETISRELSELITSAGYDRDTLTLDQLRHALAEYVQDILLEAKEDLNKLEEEELAVGAKATVTPVKPRPLRS